ncbi:hypothetical protein LLOABG_LLOABG_16755, partial [Dysosmobacter welbionis]
KAERAERAAGQMRFCTPDFHRSPVNTQAPSHTGSAVFCTVGRGGAQFCRRRKLRLADFAMTTMGERMGQPSSWLHFPSNGTDPPNN